MKKMFIKESKIRGVFEVYLKPSEDHRGFFMRTYDDKIFEQYGLCRNWVQESHSYSLKKGIIRGLHFQLPPHTETKLVRVVTGKIFMVFVDLREKSSTFSQWNDVILSEDNKKMLYVPKGFALGMCTLTDHCTLLYKMDSSYVPETQRIIRWNDPNLGIEWPLDGEPILSERDKNAKSFKEFVETHKAI